MQVTHTNDHITHAVIGGSKTIEVGISNSAEFFHIFSSTLYKDQILAVVREVLCNGWDAHIEANRTDKPVEITLTPDKFIIKDFGKGIHLDDMGPIYGVIGNSTKKNDGKQTGGFGLGCKAPWAYNEHFEVQSCHDGVKTIYNLSKSSAQAMGKPGITPIASFPTTDTGLQVSISIKNMTDYRRFEQLVKRIVYNGDMNMTLNGKEMPRINMTGSYLIIKETQLLETQPQIMIRYGNVIYPVDKVPELNTQMTAIVRHLDSLRTPHSGLYCLVLQAPPHSITVQPSREGLSMQEHTINTLKTLMAKFLDGITVGFKDECNKYAKLAVQEAVKEADIEALLAPAEKLPFKGDFTNMQRIDNLVDMARRYMESNYPRTLEFRKADIRFRIEQMVAGGLLNRGLAQTFLRELSKLVTYGGQFSRGKTEWVQRHVVARLCTKMLVTGLDVTRLMAFDSTLQNAPKNYYNRDVPPLVEASKMQPTHLFSTLPYLRNIVVLSTSRSNLWERVKRHETFAEQGKHQGFLFYHVPMKKTDKDAAMAFFQQSGMIVVDLTVKQAWEIEEEARRPVYVAPPRKPPKVGLPKLKTMQSSHWLDFKYSLADEAERTENPEFLLLASMGQKDTRDRLDPWNTEETRIILELFGDKGAITNNSATATKWYEKGVEKFDTYMRNKVLDFMLTNENIREYWAYHPDRVMEHGDISNHDFPKYLFKAFYKSPVMRQHYGLKCNLTPEEAKMLKLWEGLVRTNRRYNMPDDMMKVFDYLNSIPLALANLQPVLRFKHSKLIRMFSSTDMLDVLEKNGGDTPEAKTAIEILSLALQ